MNNVYFKSSILVCVSFLTLSACSQKKEATPRVAVSGVVTVNQEAMPGIEVTFIPDKTTALANVPHGTAVTSKDGKFQLKSRDGQNGVLPGDYTVSFAFDDSLETEIGFLTDRLKDLEQGDPENEMASVDEELKELRSQLAKRSTISLAKKFKFKVPHDGTSDANFQLESRPPR